MSYYGKNSACYHARTPIDKVLAITPKEPRSYLREEVSPEYTLQHFDRSFEYSLFGVYCSYHRQLICAPLSRWSSFGFRPPPLPPFPPYFMYYKWFCTLPSEGGRQTFIPQWRSEVKSEVDRILYLPLIYLLTVNLRNSLITVTMMSNLKRMLGQKS